MGVAEAAGRASASVTTLHWPSGPSKLELAASRRQHFECTWYWDSDPGMLIRRFDCVVQ